MNGVPLDAAMQMSRVRRLAFIVAFGELQGKEFNWQRMSFADEDS